MFYQLKSFAAIDNIERLSLEFQAFRILAKWHIFYPKGMVRDKRLGGPTSTKRCPAQKRLKIFPYYISKYSCSVMWFCPRPVLKPSYISILSRPGWRTTNKCIADDFWGLYYTFFDSAGNVWCWQCTEHWFLLDIPSLEYPVWTRNTASIPPPLQW